MLELLGLPTAASTHAAEIDRILVLTHWLMAVLALGWGGYFIYTLIRFRRKAQPVAIHGGITAGWSKYVEAAVVLTEVVLLVFFSIPAYSARVTNFPDAAGSTEVRVVAEQFAWNVHYPGADGLFGRSDLLLVSPANPLGLDLQDAAARDDVTTVNELNLPVGKPVIVYLTSKDVIHSFALPQMRVKQDVIPGTVQVVWFTPVQVGEWEIVCSQLCGLAHYRMRGFYKVQPEAAFRTWLTASRTRP